MALRTAGLAASQTLPSGLILPSPTINGNAVGVVQTMAQWGVPFIVPASHTMGNNGALTALATALNVVYPGAWVWMATGQIAAASLAGWYWFVPSSTTAGTLFNSTYAAGQPGLGTATPFVTTGPGANTGVIVEVFGPTITIGAGAVGPSGCIVHNYHASANAGSAKTYRVHYSDTGGTVVAQQAPTTAAAGNLGYIQNSGVTNKQVATNIQAITSESIGTSYPAVDTTLASKVVFSINKSAAIDNAVIERGFVQVGYGL